MYCIETRMNEAGEMEEFSEMLARVAIELGEENWAAHVNLTEGKVVRLTEVNLQRVLLNVSSDDLKVEYFLIEEGPVEEPVFHIGNGGIEKGTK